MEVFLFKTGKELLNSKQSFYVLFLYVELKDMDKQYILDLLQNNLDLLIDLLILDIFLFLKDFIMEIAIKKKTKVIKFLKENAAEFSINLAVTFALFLLSCFWKENTYILVISIILSVVYIAVIFAIYIYKGTEEEKIDGMNYIILFIGLWAVNICVSYF